MKIEKHGNLYRVRKTHKCKTYILSFDHKPTNAEILDSFAEMLKNNPVSDHDNISFKVAAEKYVDMKRNILSPTTLRDYTKFPDRMSDWFVEMGIYDITQVEINKQINELATTKSPKTVRNYHGFISSVLRTFRPDMNISTILPQKKKYEPYAPTKDDVKRILNDVKDTEYYVPLCLACYGLRRGETCALTLEDIDGDLVHINKSLALNENKEWVVKSTKTVSGTRDIIIPMWLADKIREQGFVFKGHPNQILKALQRSQLKLGIPKFSLHMLRHYFAAVLSETCDDQTIMEMGGWQSDYVMKRVYRYSLSNKIEEKKREAMLKINDSIIDN